MSSVTTHPDTLTETRPTTAEPQRPPSGVGPATATTPQPRLANWYLGPRTYKRVPQANGAPYAEAEAAKLRETPPPGVDPSEVHIFSAFLPKGKQYNASTHRHVHAYGTQVGWKDMTLCETVAGSDDKVPEAERELIPLHIDGDGFVPGDFTDEECEAKGAAHLKAAHAFVKLALADELGEDAVGPARWSLQRGDRRDVKRGVKGLKLSVHIIVHGLLAFRTPADQRAFWERACGRHPDAAKEVGIDLAIYSRRRMFRLPGCVKAPGKPGLLPLVPAAECDGQKMAWSAFLRLSADEWLEHTLVWLPDDPEPQVYTVPTAAEDSDGKEAAAPARKRARRGRADSTAETAGGTALSSPSAAGDLLAQLSKLLPESQRGHRLELLPHVPGTVVRLQNQGPRTCLVTPGRTHDSNNAYLAVGDNGEVTYKCHSEHCAGRSVRIGRLPSAEPAACRLPVASGHARHHSRA